ncbi:DUF4906 domain-containing protein [Millionella massiliensis]|uniref:DUF4906 domain-containing protein n=1 Tax=Millionella massiliensis TaxID=1871023 RepID=UPI0008DAC9A7|nr:DUF4906 domain-containing protein [Millionella massiliensis]
MKTNKKTAIWTGLFLAALTLFSACQKRDSDGLDIGDGQSIYLSMAVPEIEEVVVTRAMASDIEKVIYSVWILAFDQNGTCFYKESVHDGFEANKPYDAHRALAIPKQTGDQYKECTVWVLANVGKYDGAEGSYDFESVTTLDDFNQLYAYRLLQDNGSGTASSPRKCLPMTGSALKVDLTQATSIGRPLSIKMERAVAKVSFNISVKEGLEFYFNNWSVEGLSRYTYVADQGVNHDYADDNQGITDPYNPYYPSNVDESNLVTVGVGAWLTDANLSAAAGGFYTYENRRGGRLGAPNIGNLQGDAGDYAQEIKDKTDATGTDPRFKTLYAPANAAFLVLTGLIRDQVTQNVASFTYKIALGANNTNDYNLLRDHNYVYNIGINGTTYNDITVDAFDSRVHEAYALQISAPESERMDAHFDKRYLDITASAGELELQFYPTMKDAEDGTNPLTAVDWISLSKMNTYNIDIDPDENVVQKATYADISRQRFYVYTDENLSTTSRSVVLKVTHTPASESSEIVKNPVSRYYTYTQAGMIEANGLWVESYEEYGMNLDPYSSDQPTQGLQWGWSGVEAFTPKNNFDDATYDLTSNQDGMGNTLKIITYEAAGNSAFNGVDVNSIYNNYAARYCDNKNKRDKNGKIIEHKWYLPAIDELKPLTLSVTTDNASWKPESMVGKGYWSASVPSFEEVNKKPWWLFWDFTGLVWSWIQGYINSPDSEFYYTKVAKAAIDGEEQRETIPGGISGSEWFPKRVGMKHVRAVRIKE